MTGPLRVLTVCTHNRTRSVIAAALLGEHLRALDVDVIVRSVGTHGDGHPATEGALRLLRERGIDATRHRARRLDDNAVSGADLIVTAEAGQVVAIAGQWPDAFAKTFTLPEVVELGRAAGPRAGRPIGVWLADVAARRPPSATYLDADGVSEVADPTGGPRRQWVTSFAEIDRLTVDLAGLLR